MTPAELIEKLGRKTQRFPASGGGSIGIGADGKTTSSSYVTDDGYRLVNPDGPEAATALTELFARVEELEEALREVDRCLANAGSPVLARKIARAALRPSG